MAPKRVGGGGTPPGAGGTSASPRHLTATVEVAHHPEGAPLLTMSSRGQMTVGFRICDGPLAGRRAWLMLREDSLHVAEHRQLCFGRWPVDEREARALLRAPLRFDALLRPEGGTTFVLRLLEHHATPGDSGAGAGSHDGPAQHVSAETVLTRPRPPRGP